MVIAGAVPLMLSVRERESWPKSLLAVIVRSKLPHSLGVPEIVPVESYESPAGNVPVTLQVMGVVPVASRVVL